MPARGSGSWRGYRRRRTASATATALVAALLAALVAAPAAPSAAIPGLAGLPGTPGVTLTTFTADANGQTGAYQVPAHQVPAAAFQPTSATSGSSVEAISFFHSSFFHSSFFHSSFFHSSFFHSSFFHSGLTDTSFFHSSFFHSSFFHSPLDTTLLSDIPLLYPDPCGNQGATPPQPACTGWLGLIHDTHSALEGQPLQMISLIEVLDDPQVGPVLKQLPTGDIDLTHTPLGDLPFAALALGGLPLKRLPLVGVPGATPMEQWCNVLGSAAVSIDCAGDLGIDPLHPDAVPWSDGVSVLTLALLGVSMDNLPLDSIALSTLDSSGHPLIDLSGTPVGDAPVAELDLHASALGDVPVHQVAIGNTTLAGRTLGSLSGLASTPLGAITLSGLTLTGSPFGAVRLDQITVDAVPAGPPIGGTFGGVALGSTALDAIPLADATTVGGAPLSRLTFAGTAVGDTALSALTLAVDSGIGSITYDQLGGLLGSVVDCTKTDCTAAGLTLTDAKVAGALTGKVADLAGHALTGFDTTTLSGLVDAMTPQTVALDRLIPLLAPADAAALTLAALVPALPVATAGAVKLADLVAHSPALAGLSVGDLLAASDGNGATLGQLVGALDDASGLQVADLLHGIDGQAVVLGDLLVGFLSASPEDLPFERLDVSGVSLPPLADHNPGLSPPITYTATLDVTDGGPGAPAHVAIAATMPQGFVLEPGSAVLDGGPGGDPAETVGPSHEPVLTWSEDLTTGLHTFVFRAWAGLSETVATTTAEAHLAGDPSGSPLSAATSIVDASSTDPSAPFPMVPGDLYLGHLHQSRPTAYFSVHVPAAGQRLTLLLGNLPADYDLVLYALSATPHLRGTPTRTLTPVDDGQLSLAPLDQSLPPETLQDVPLLAGHIPYAVSANHNTTEERIDTGQLDPGDYLVQVSAFNGAADNVNPFTLRARLTDDPAASCPNTHTYDFPADEATTLPPADPAGAFDTLVLVNSDRLAKTWGAAGEQQVMDSLAGFVAQHPAKVLPLESVDAIRNDYAAWDADPCSIAAANQVVTDVGHQIDAVTAANPGLRYVVLVGSDNLLPMARVRDATVLANERTFAQNFPGVANELTASLAGGYVLTDDPYGTASPVTTAGRDVFVPQLAVGRLVETPAQIAKSLDDFVAQHGALPSSATGLATGYDFLRDGAAAVARGLNASGNRPVDTTLIGDTWTKTDLASRLLPATGAPAIDSINGHFDQSAMLPAVGGASNAFGVGDIPLPPSGPPPLQGRLVFSMGCHAGFNVPAQLGVAGTTADWADTFAQQGALWIANTGYGYGDDKTVALSEHLMALLADQLDSAGSIGNAYVSAKRAYAAGLAVASPYDEKTLMEATFYGLPMYALPAPPGGGTAPPVLGAPGVPAVEPALGLGTPTIFSAPIAKTIPDGTSSPGAGKFTFVPDGSGSALDGHYEIDGQTVTVQQRPIQPRVELNVSPGAVPPGLPPGYVAKGALITGLGSTDYVGFKPDFFRPSLDNSQTERSQDVGDAAFPAGMQTVTSYRAADGSTTQHLVLVPAQFRPTPGLDVPGRGVERLFTQVAAKVLYGPDDGDNISATIFRWSAVADGGVLTATAHIEDLADPSTLRFTGVSVVTVLYSLSSSPGTWQKLDLRPAGTDGDWVGSVTGIPPGAKADAVLQAVRWNGTVATSTMKAAFFNAQAPSSTGPFRFRLTGGARGANGWWKVSPAVAVTPPLGDLLTQQITYQVDDGPVKPYSGVFPIGGDGIHNITVSQTGFNSSHLQVLVDSRAPNPAIDFPSGPNLPTINDKGWFNQQPLTVDIVPTDPGGGQGSGVDTVTYSATGANVIPPTTQSEPPVGSPPISAQITQDGRTVFSVSATDRAGNASAPGAFPVNLDTAKPVVTITADPALVPANNGWHRDTVHVTISATDPLPPATAGKVASGIASITYQLGGAPSQTVDAQNPDHTAPLTFQTDFDVPAEGISSLSVDVLDIAGNDDHEDRKVEIDRTAPSTSATVTPQPTGGGYSGPASATVTLSATDRPGDGVPATDVSGVDHVTFTASGAQAVATTTGTSYVVHTEGWTTITFHATDVAGNDEPDGSVTVKLDLHAPTFSCPPVDPNWRATDQTFACTSADPLLADGNLPSGLAHPDDASFTLATNVPDGTQTASASTGSKIVCDTVSNCATKGPLGPVKVDKKAPIISIPLPLTSTNPAVPVGTPTSVPTYLLNQPEKLTFSCDDNVPNGSGVAFCGSAVERLPSGVTVARAQNGALDTTQIGLHTVSVTSRDKVGNTRTTSVQFRVVYNVCPQYDPTKASSIGGTVVLKVRLCTYSGVNVSSAALTLHAYQVDGKSTLLTPNFSGSSNDGFVFRYDPSTATYLYNLKTTSAFVVGDNVMTYAVNGVNGGAGGDPVTGPFSNSGTLPYSATLLYRAPFRMK